QVEKIEGILPAIAIDQVNPVRTSRSSVGTMTEINDHLKLMFAKLAHLHCQQCGQEVKEDNVQTIVEQLQDKAKVHGDPRLVITFPVTVPKNFTKEEIKNFLEQQGFTRIQAEEESS